MKTLLVSLIWLIACQEAALRPVEIAAEDMCALCKMAISEKRFAAEFINRDGDAFKFDDISCMTRYIEGKRNRNAIAGYFVVDFDSREWVRGEEAHYVRSSELQTPMGGGIVAFKDRPKAEAAVTKYQGEHLSFNDLLNSPQRHEGIKTH
ncbi:MAG: nitrous oxide reductase accessory protein NosL [Acidobacteria bacterium]|nr:nitrous oxide reductase accessory protein NosL [Acidobacteriota bacterium]